jgi:hypothetical protein
VFSLISISLTSDVVRLPDNDVDNVDGVVAGDGGDAVDPDFAPRLDLFEAVDEADSSLVLLLDLGRDGSGVGDLGGGVGFLCRSFTSSSSVGGVGRPRKKQRCTRSVCPEEESPQREVKSDLHGIDCITLLLVYNFISVK